MNHAGKITSISIGKWQAACDCGWFEFHDFYEAAVEELADHLSTMRQQRVNVSEATAELLKMKKELEDG